MGLVIIGLSHKTAPVDLRERLALPAEQLAAALDRLSAMNELQESVILSTCNRLEIYARPQADRPGALQALRKFLREFYTGVSLDSVLYQHEAQKAVNHLFRVAAGLDSLVVGESEILGQVKSAYALSQAHGTTGKITNVLFQRAIFVGKNVRTQTGVSEGSSSVGSIAIQLAQKIFGSLAGRHALILGAGEMAEVTARHLLSQKPGDIVVLNRTLENAQALASQLNGTAGSLDQLESFLEWADVVICSATVERPLVTTALVQRVMHKRRGRSLYFVDIAVPRNVESPVHDLENVYLYNIDDLRELVEENMVRRRHEVDRAETLVQRLATEFYDWILAALEGKNKALKHDL